MSDNHTSLRARLTADHRSIEQPIDDWATGSADSADPTALARAVAALRSHIHVEEEHVFPPLAAAGNQMPVMAMIREHAQMWPILDDIDAELDGAADAGKLAELCRALADILADHTAQEEEGLYPQADKVLAPEAGATVDALLESRELPEGWTAHGVPRE